MNKYRARKTTVDNITFDSAKEANRYGELKLLERAGEISDLELQPKFDIEINGVKVCTYRADFAYKKKWLEDFDVVSRVIEDVKGMRTPVYRLKKKLMLAVHGLTITEV